MEATEARKKQLRGKCCLVLISFTFSQGVVAVVVDLSSADYVQSFIRVDLKWLM